MVELCPRPKALAGDPGKHGPAVRSSAPEVSEPGNVAAPQQRAGPTPTPAWGLLWSIRTATLSRVQVAAQVWLFGVGKAENVNE